MSTLLDAFAPQTSARGFQTKFVFDSVALPQAYRHKQESYATRWQPALADGRRLFKYGILAPEWIDPRSALDGHRPVLFTTPGKALDAAVRQLLKDEKASKKKGGKFVVDRTWAL